MNAPKVTDWDYIDFLVAAPRRVSWTAAAQSPPPGPHRAAHDAFPRLLQRQVPPTTVLGAEAQEHVDRTRGLLLVADPTLAKPSAQHIALVHRHWSGQQHRVVSGVNLVTRVWSAGPHAIPCD